MERIFYSLHYLLPKVHITSSSFLANNWNDIACGKKEHKLDPQGRI